MTTQMKLKTNMYDVYPVADKLKWIVINKSAGHIIATFTSHTMASFYVEYLNSGKVPYYTDKYEVRELYEETP